MQRTSKTEVERLWAELTGSPLPIEEIRRLQKVAAETGVPLGNIVHTEEHRLVNPAAPEWAYFDYMDGWVGVRVEPENQDRANAIKANIPKEERRYLGNKRKWIFKPKWTSTVVEILGTYCPDVEVILEEENWELLQALIVGPRAYLQASPVTGAGPVGRAFGRLSDIQDW